VILSWLELKPFGKQRILLRSNFRMQYLTHMSLLPAQLANLSRIYQKGADNETN
jgi:hypothetical protein